MPKTCPSCQASSPDGAGFCIACGARFPAPDPSTPSVAVADGAPPAATSGFSVRWMFLSILFLFGGVVAASVVAGIIAVLLGVDVENEDVVLVLGAVATILGLFGGAVVTGWRSPGVTIREPVVAIIVVIVAANLLTGDVAGAAVGWLIPALLAFGGARLGERMQRRRRG